MSTIETTNTPARCELRLVDPRVVRDNPDNVRGVGRDREGLAASILQLGVLQPPLVREDGEGFLWLIAGERRKHSAIAAGLTEIPVYVRTDLTPVKEVAGMLSENHHRDDLTEVEEAVAIGRLFSMDGVSQKAITELTGIPRTQVRTALKLRGSEPAVAVAQRHDLSLEEAIVLAEFDGDAEAIKKLTVTAIKFPYRFGHVANRLRHEKRDAELRAVLVAQLTEAGVQVVDLGDDETLPDGAAWLTDLVGAKGRALTEAGHRRCLGHAAAVVDGYEEPAVAYVCTDPVTHGHDQAATVTEPGIAKASGMTDEQKVARRKVVANNKTWPVAGEVRREFMKELVARRSVPKPTLRYVAEALAADPKVIDVTDDRVGDVVGKDGGRWERTCSRGLVTEATDQRLPLALLALVAAGVEDRFSRKDSWRQSDWTLVRYLGFLADIGYGLSELEQELVDAAEPPEAS